MNKGSFDRYEHKDIEVKWQKEWLEKGIYTTSNDLSKPKCYVLDMFPYPSGDGLHVGHPKGYIATDVFSRYKRMNGFSILHPMGWDAFGLPAEQYALKNKVHPRVAVEANCKRFKEQLSKIGFNYDWDREINTTDTDYYKWTQWTFIKMFEKGLAYQSFEPINWCPSCMTGLANEDLDGDNCERCGTKVEQKPIRQWVLKITDYADRMLDDLETLNWPHSIKESQRNWIGKSKGAILNFAFENTDNKISVFTTRPDTLYGVTYLAISHVAYRDFVAKGLIKEISTVLKFADEVKSEEEARVGTFAEIEEKKGIDTGAYVLHPITNAHIPIWIGNYVLSDYGTGAVMGVAAHDTRDFDFAIKYGLKIVQVISESGVIDAEMKEAYIDDGILVNSQEFNGKNNRDASEDIVKKSGGELKTQYRLKDWVFARQRYWGEPIPVVFDVKTEKPYAVDDTDLPVVLPQVESYEPTGTGESPLALILSWVNVKGYITSSGTFKQVKDGEVAPEGVIVSDYRRESNTMPQWAGSSWYYLRYIDPKNGLRLVDKEKEAYWSPVDLYVGGAEHATRHLIYARFWHKFLFDIGVVSKIEPFSRLQNVGLIMASDGRKMSKRYGNVINPDDIIETFGADTLRVYEMFMGPFDQAIAWSTDNLVGSRRFIERVWKLANNVGEGEIQPETDILINQTIAKVGDDIESFKFNTAISQLMICLNHLEKLAVVPSSVFVTFITLLAPFAPHITEELSSIFGDKTLMYQKVWPTFDSSKLMSDTVSIAVSVNGKLRDTFSIKRDTDKAEVEKTALESDIVKKWIGDNEIKKIIVVPNKIVNIVI